ncbi:MAG: oligosaccharide flippase family protein [Candidatus Bathyarchaeia archaeon]
MGDEVIQVTQDSARGGFFLLSGTATATVIMAIGSIIIARILSPSLYGQYSLTLIVPQILLLFTELGINQGITKFVAELRSRDETDRIGKIIKHGLLIRAIMGIAVFAITYIFSDFFAYVFLQRPELAFYLRLASTSILFQVLLTTTAAAFVGMDKAEYSALSTTIQAIAKTIISIILVLLGFAVTGAIIGHVASIAISSMVGISLLFLVLRKNRKITQPGGFSRDARTLFKYGAPLYISIILTGFIPLFSNLILAFFVSDADVGNYKAAINFAALLTVLANPIATALLPAFSKLSSTNKAIIEFFKFANKYTAIVIVPATFLVILFSNQIVQIVYGSTYSSAACFLSIYCLLYLLVGIGYLTLASLYNGLGETKITMQISTITFVFIIILAPLMTKFYGVQGLIIAFLIANIAGQGYAAYTAQKKFQIKFDFPALIKIYSIALVSSVFPLLVINFVSLPTLIIVAIGGILYLFIYITLLPITRVITTYEFSQVTKILQRIPIIAFIVKPLLKYQQKLLTKIAID